MKKTIAQDTQITPAAADKWSEALLLAYGRLPTAERVEKAAAAIQAVRRGELSLDGLFVAQHNGRIVGAMLAQPMPGKTALIWPPQLSDPEPQATAQQLLAHSIEWLRGRDIHVAQSLLPHDDLIDAQRLRQAGFAHAADLVFMFCPIPRPAETSPATDLEFEAFAETETDRLATLVEKTYEDSLDCPAIDKMRKTRDVLEGYRQTGVFSADRWLFVRHEQHDVGCLLLADHPAQQQWELVYMGLVPEARGRGYGLQIVQHAQRLAEQAQRRALLLAVDAANDPAIAVYSAAGFAELFQRQVYLKAL